MNIIQTVTKNLFRRPRSITSMRIVDALARRITEPMTVIDGGANVGQFARAIVEQFPKAKVYSFEPSPSVASQYRRNLGDAPQVELFESALGHESGSLQFFPNQFDQAASALHILPAHDELSHQHPTKELAPINVPVNTLDEMAAKFTFNPPVLLKLDLQGYELNALRGAMLSLGKIDFVLLETVFAPVYEGEPLFPEILDFMRETGFDFLGPVSVMRDAHGDIRQMDALFRRGDSPFVAS